MRQQGALNQQPPRPIQATGATRGITVSGDAGVTGLLHRLAGFEVGQRFLTLFIV